MTKTQKQALRLMDEQGIGAMPVKGFGWVFPTHVRNDGERFGHENAMAAARGIIRQLGEERNYQAMFTDTNVGDD